MTLDRLGQNGEDEAGSKPAGLWFLLPATIVATALLFACGQLALVVRASPGAADTRSNLTADYARWDFMPMAPLDPAFLAKLAAELDIDTSIVDSPVCLLPDSGCDSSPTPSPTPTRLAPTATAPVGGMGATPTPTHTIWAPVLPTATEDDSGGHSAPSPTATSTPDTPTATNTPVTPTATSTPTICAAPCEPDVGAPDGGFATVMPGATRVYNLGGPIVVDGTPEPEWDLLYYERTMGGWPAPYILMDLVVLQIAVDPSGTWYVVFDWGDDIPDTNSNVAAFAAGGENPNENIPQSALYGTPNFNTGIAIDVDSVVPTGEYSWLSIVAPTPVPPAPPYGADERTEVDAVEVLPTPTPP